MKYFRHGDPLDDFDYLDRRRAEREAKLPQCEKCGRHIDDDTYFEVDGEILCEGCMHDLYARSTEDWLRDNF